MEKRCYRIRKGGYQFLIVCEESCSKYKIFSEFTYVNEFGRRFGKIKKFMTYNSIEDMQSDFGGFLDYIEYEEGDEIKDDYGQIEAPASNDQRGLGDGEY